MSEMSLTQHTLQPYWRCMYIFIMVWCCCCKSKPFFKSFSQYGIESLTSVLSNAWLEKDLREKSFHLLFPSSFPNLCSLQSQVHWKYCSWLWSQQEAFPPLQWAPAWAPLPLDLLHHEAATPNSFISSFERESLRRRICPSSSGGRRFHSSRLAAMLSLPLSLCDCAQAWRALFMLLDIIALPRHRRQYLSSPLPWRVATQTH